MLVRVTPLTRNLQLLAFLIINAIQKTVPLLNQFNGARYTMAFIVDAFSGSHVTQKLNCGLTKSIAI